MKNNYGAAELIKWQTRLCEINDTENWKNPNRTPHSHYIVTVIIKSTAIIKGFHVLLWLL